MPEQPIDILRGGLAELSLAVPPACLDQLARLADLVASWGSRLNLTGHRTPQAVAERLILDAAALWSALELEVVEANSLVDLGSGAGFPGLPIAILEPSLSVVLVEARERRHHFQRHAIRQLDLPNVHAVRGRYEALEPRLSGVVVAQAVAQPQRLLSDMLRWAAPRAVLAVPGGTTPREPAGTGGLESTDVLSYQVPRGGPSRTVWVGRVSL